MGCRSTQPVAPGDAPARNSLNERLADRHAFIVLHNGSTLMGRSVTVGPDSVRWVAERGAVPPRGAVAMDEVAELRLLRRSTGARRGFLAGALADGLIYTQSVGEGGDMAVPLSLLLIGLPTAGAGALFGALLPPHEIYRLGRVRGLGRALVSELQ